MTSDLSASVRWNYEGNYIWIYGGTCRTFGTPDTTQISSGYHIMEILHPYLTTVLLEGSAPQSVPEQLSSSSASLISTSIMPVQVNVI